MGSAIKENRFTTRDMELLMECDFCGVYVECEDGSAFCDGTLYSDLDNVACNDCCGQLKYGKEQSND